MVLEGERFKLRAYQASDAPALAELGNNGKIWRNMTNLWLYPYTLEAAETWIEQEPQTDPPRYCFVIEIDNAFAGGMGYTLGDDGDCG